MTGRLRTIGRILSIYANDLSDANATPEEREVSRLLTAVNAAIVLDATESLAEVVAPWWAGQALDATQEMVWGLRRVD